MTDIFELPVQYKGLDLSFSARLLVKGYIHQFEVDIDGLPVYFERDDNSEYRAIVDANNIDLAKKPDTGLLQAIATAIESILK